MIFRSGFRGVDINKFTGVRRQEHRKATLQIDRVVLGIILLMNIALSEAVPAQATVDAADGPETGSARIAAANSVYMNEIEESVSVLLAAQRTGERRSGDTLSAARAQQVRTRSE